MSELARPEAARLGRARWLDPRLLLGVVLVLASVATGAKVVAQADDSYPVWAVRHDLAQRSALADGDLEQRRVRIEGAASAYVAVDGAPPIGWVLTRAVTAGELLPRAALARPDALPTRRVSVPVEPAVAADLADGAVVDVYVVPRADAPRTASPAPVRRVLSGVTVAKVERGGRGLAGSSSRSSVVLVLRVGAAPVAAGDGSAAPADDVTAFLEAQSRGDIQLVRASIDGAG